MRCGGHIHHGEEATAPTAYCSRSGRGAVAVRLRCGGAVRSVEVVLALGVLVLLVLLHVRRIVEAAIADATHVRPAPSVKAKHIKGNHCGSNG